MKKLIFGILLSLAIIAAIGLATIMSTPVSAIGSQQPNACFNQCFFDCIDGHFNAKEEARFCAQVCTWHCTPRH